MFEVTNGKLFANSKPFVMYKDARLLAQYSNILLTNFIYDSANPNVRSTHPDYPEIYDFKIRIQSAIDEIIFDRKLLRDKNTLQVSKYTQRKKYNNLENKDFISKPTNYYFEYDDLKIYILNVFIASGRYGISSMIFDDFNMIVTSDDLKHHQLANFNEKYYDKQIIPHITSIGISYKIKLSNKVFYVIKNFSHNFNGEITNSSRLIVITESEYLKLKLKL